MTTPTPCRGRFNGVSNTSIITSPAVCLTQTAFTNVITSRLSGKGPTALVLKKRRNKVLRILKTMEGLRKRVTHKLITIG